MDIEEAKEILKCCMNDDCTKCEYADVFDCVKKHNEAIETVLEELENKQDDINILQAQRDSMEYQFKQAKAELEKKENIIKALVDYLIEGLQTKSYEEKICMEDILNKIENLGYEFENPCNMRNMFKNVTKLEKIEWKNKVEREGK